MANITVFKTVYLGSSPKRSVSILCIVIWRIYKVCACGTMGSSQRLNPRTPLLRVMRNYIK
nr:MAG TPA: hypothetical protein [Caudoviricetes sp.]